MRVGEYSSATMATRRTRGWSLVTASTIAISFGCQTYKPEVAIGLYEQGDFAAAHEEIADPPWYAGHHDHDQIIWLLEEAKLKRKPPEKEMSRDIALVIGAHFPRWHY